MQISFSIASEEYETLVQHAPESSPATRPLVTAAISSRLDGDGIAQAYELTCDDPETQDLLSLAHAHCPSALRKIGRAIRQAHLAENAAARDL